jgi:hypothetical protein
MIPSYFQLLINFLKINNFFHKFGAIFFYKNNHIKCIDIFLFFFLKKKERESNHV